MERIKIKRWYEMDDASETMPDVVPNMIFKTRVYDSSVEGPNPYRWQDVSTWDLFVNKRVVLFSLPGAFTPTCDTYQLPGFDRLYPEFNALGIDDIYCISVNDAFVMNAWAKAQDLKHVRVIPDGSGKFTRDMKMDVRKDNLGFGTRSWRYAVIVNNGTIEKWFIEPDPRDDADTDPYGETTPENILEWLQING